MKKKFWTIALTALLFLSAVALGLSTVFRVETVTLVANFTAQAGVSAESLQAELKMQYDKANIFSVNRSAAETTVEKYPYLRVIDFEKTYPSGLTITVAEDRETYAVECGDGYYILNEEGVVVELRTQANNRADDAPNVLVKGLTVTGKVGETLVGDGAWQSMLTLCRGMDAALTGIRKNVLSVEVLTRSPQVFYLITMREGVKIYVEEPDLLTEEKAKAAIDEYLSLTDEARMTGRISVHAIEGEVVARYSARDELA